MFDVSSHVVRIEHYGSSYFSYCLLPVFTEDDRVPHDYYRVRSPLVFSALSGWGIK
ncbi:hypothetical protein MESS2_960019 [Mesorhizobium metallidurans STM 2683]|uniref:Uncharacterized protein n=1 Tax=Mesorhizobium metallidurans STM 2683 TaxID=1297569 RepID=M5EYY4_9HYPH|nr:hypothetical protein MESS2_960019 [Mesorhizobium metallidurans STM 2683]